MIRMQIPLLSQPVALKLAIVEIKLELRITTPQINCSAQPLSPA
jgi:hypothetical protein